MPAALVTGGAGFIGSHLVEALAERGWSVRVVDDLSAGSRANLANVIDRVEFVEGSVADRETMARAARDVEVVFHLAAITSVPASMDSPVPTLYTGLMGPSVVLSAARAAGARRVVFASSSAVYGGLGPLS